MDTFEDLSDGRALVDMVRSIEGDSLLDANTAKSGVERVRAVLLFLATKDGA